jgi:phytoene synthase
LRVTSEADPYSHCEAVLKQGDRDRWLACMFAPADRRRSLHALYAFNLEVSRVAAQVTQPLLGEMRLRYWADLLHGEAPGAARENPVAAALLATVETCRLERETLLNLLEARLFDLYEDPHPDLAALDVYCDLTAGGLFALAAQILTGRPATDAMAKPAGRAYALTGLLRSLPWLAAEHHSPIPFDVAARHDASPRPRENTPQLRAALAELRAHARENLREAEAARKATPAAERPAYRALSLPKLYLAQMDKAANPLAPLPDIPQWRRQWALLRGKI